MNMETSRPGTGVHKHRDLPSDFMDFDATNRYRRPRRQNL